MILLQQSNMVWKMIGGLKREGVVSLKASNTNDEIFSAIKNEYIFYSLKWDFADILAICLKQGSVALLSSSSFSHLAILSD